MTFKRVENPKDKTSAERSKRYREKQAAEKELLRQQLTRFMAMSPQEINEIMGTKVINMHVFCSLAQAQCTKEEIAGALDMSVDTLDKRMAENPLLKQIYAKAQMYGKSSLRRKQFDVAMMGHPKMLEWLGKQYLGQTDKVENTHPNLHEEFVKGVKKSMPGAFADDVGGTGAELDPTQNSNLEP